MHRMQAGHVVRVAHATAAMRSSTDSCTPAPLRTPYLPSLADAVAKLSASTASLATASAALSASEARVSALEGKLAAAESRVRSLQEEAALNKAAQSEAIERAQDALRRCEESGQRAIRSEMDAADARKQVCGVV